MGELATIILFTYRRPDHTSATLKALQKSPLANRSDLMIFSDGAKGAQDADGVAEVRRLIRDVEGFRSVKTFESPRNMGLASSIIQGVSEVLQQVEKVIVLEDDIVTSPNFLSFCNQALEFYSQEKSVYSISGYNFSIPSPAGYPYSAYFSHRSSSWGWGTWRDRWQSVDWQVRDYPSFRDDFKARKSFTAGGDDLPDMLDRQMRGEIDSWAIRWAYAHFRAHAYCVYPAISLAENIGFDGSGTHCGTDTDFNNSQASLQLPDTRPLPNISELSKKYIATQRAIFANDLVSRIFRKIRKLRARAFG